MKQPQRQRSFRSASLRKPKTKPEPEWWRKRQARRKTARWQYLVHARESSAEQVWDSVVMVRRPVDAKGEGSKDTWKVGQWSPSKPGR